MKRAESTQPPVRLHSDGRFLFVPHGNPAPVYCKIRLLEEAGIAQRKTASFYLRELERTGLLTPFKAGREVYFINEPFLKILVS